MPMSQNQITRPDRPMNSADNSFTVDPVMTTPWGIVDETVLPGWRKIKGRLSTVWLKGHLFGDGERQLVDASGKDVPAIRAAIENLDGCFAVIVKTENAIVAAADRIGSVPVFLTRSGYESAVSYRVGGLALPLAAKAGLTQVDRQAALEIGLAGYVLGDKALLEGIVHLRAGQIAVLKPGREPELSFYFTYRPWKVVERPRERLMSELADVLHRVFSKLVTSADGRPIMVPLSAGFDSRLIAAALKQLRYPDIRCYAYGLPGNHEAATSRAVAERLGVRWTFVPITPASQRRYFDSADHADFVHYADTLTAVPFHQDNDATRRLIATGYAPRDAIFVNGQTGDYITGNHVPQELWTAPPFRDPEARWTRLFAAARAKHFDLWRHLATATNLTRIETQFRADLERFGGLTSDPASDWALYEVSEYVHRQARYVVAGQRCYEHLGYDWRLPFWDRDLISFYESVPLSAKISQSLYKETIRHLNWGDVWALPVNRRNVRPRWIAPLRLFTKALCAPLGRDKWHRIERNFFAWHMDTLANYAVVPWKRVMLDRRGFRNAISWHAEAHLARHGIALDSLVA
jgi:asparagine synthase (glutamine-hydrolysing)